MSKILEKIIYERVSEALETCSNQFGFKAKHSTDTSKEPVCPRVELIFKIIIILLIIFLGFIKSKPC